MDGSDELLGTPVVPNGLAHGFDRPLERCITDKVVWPDLLSQLLLRDQAVAMRQQVGEDLKRFGPQPDGPIGAMQGMPLGVKGAITEDVDHWGDLRLGPADRQFHDEDRHLPWRPAQRAAPSRVPVACPDSKGTGVPLRRKYTTKGQAVKSEFSKISGF
jgi:hypothetical protein